MYLNEFYVKYFTYLHEDEVREGHDLAFKRFNDWSKTSKHNVIDLGCGLCEYLWFGKPENYIGIDLSPQFKPFSIEGDYTKKTFEIELPFEPSAFVSLFSAECCMSPKKKYHLYNRMFEHFPSIKFGLVSGFFYESRKDKELVQETGGITSYQSIETPIRSDVFTECRWQTKMPSTMFGSDVVEVWKFLERKR